MWFLKIHIGFALDTRWKSVVCIMLQPFCTLKELLDSLMYRSVRELQSMSERGGKGRNSFLCWESCVIDYIARNLSQSIILSHYHFDSESVIIYFIYYMFWNKSSCWRVTTTHSMLMVIRVAWIVLRRALNHISISRAFELVYICFIFVCTN